MRVLPLVAAERFGRHMACDLMTAMAEFWQACYGWPDHHQPNLHPNRSPTCP